MCIGELHPEWVQKYDLPNAPVLFELDFAAVLQQAGLLPKFQNFRRLRFSDLAVVVDQKLLF